MEDLKNNGLVWVVGILLLLIAGAYFGGPIVLDRITDRVIDKLQKEYAPGPYAPGIDPDRVNPDFFRRQQQQQQQQPWQQQQQQPRQYPSTDMPSTADWNQMWERHRN
jgi:hypothetical protein